MPVERIEVERGEERSSSPGMSERREGEGGRNDGMNFPVIVFWRGGEGSPDELTQRELLVQVLGGRQCWDWNDMARLEELMRAGVEKEERGTKDGASS